MAISASSSMIASQIKNALSMGQSAKQSTFASLVSTAIGNGVLMGQYPAVPSPIPLVSTPPIGQSLILSALSMGQGATIETTSQLLAQAFLSISPMTGVAGLSFLKAQIKNALSMGQGADISTVSQIIGNAIPIAMSMGGAI